MVCAWAAAITALMTGHAYATSARIAARMGPFAGFHENAEPMVHVLRKHQSEAAKIDEDVVRVTRQPVTRVKSACCAPNQNGLRK